MAANTAKKRWIKAIVLTVGVADCVGLYYAQQKLNTPVPDEIRYDRTAIMVPEEHNMFRAGQPTEFALATPRSAIAPDAAPVAAVPQLAKAESAAPAVSSAPKQAAAAPAIAPRLAAAPVRPAPAATAAPVAAPKLAIAAPAPQPRAIVTPHVAKLEKPAAGFYPAPAKLSGNRQSSALSLASAAPQAKVTLAKAAAPAKAAKAPTAAKKPVSAGFASLVPHPREHSEFAQAFAAFDAPVESSVQLELALPTIHPSRVSGAASDFASAATPLLETPLPAPTVELPPMTATADTPEAKL